MALDILAKLKETRVVPVSVFDNVDDSLRVAEMLMKRNMSFIEVTMRTVEALDCIEAIARRFPEMALGAGSVLDGDMLKQAAGAGAAFAVAPGLDSEVLSLARYMNMPFVPGITTPSELMAAMKFGSIIKCVSGRCPGRSPVHKRHHRSLRLHGAAPHAHRRNR